VTATATVSGADGVGAPTAATFTLSHDVDETPTERVDARRTLVNSVTGYDVVVTRTGLPIDETFILLNISRPAVLPGSDSPQPSIASEDLRYIVDHVGQLTSLSVDTVRADAPLTATRTNPFPVAQRTGFTMLARWEADDPCMAFSDPSQPIDVSRFQDQVFTTLSTVFVAADAASDRFSLSGSGDDGDFELHFVPHARHSTRVEFGMPLNGFTLIFSATVRVLTGEARIFVPLSVLFAPLPSVGGGTSLTGFLDLVELGAESEDRGRVTVLADGGAGNVIREEIVGVVGTMPAARREALATAMGAFSAALNSVRPDGGAGRLPETARVVLFPGPAPQGAQNRLIPDAGLQPRLCILD
jgi:hypothetical protein